jgi:hypothetical protein
MPENSSVLNHMVSWPGDIIAGKLQTVNWSARLEATTDRLVLKGPRSVHYELPSKSVKGIRIAVGRFLFFSWTMKKTIRIVHSESEIPEVLAFRSRKASASEIVSQLQALGYNVIPSGPEVA